MDLDDNHYLTNTKWATPVMYVEELYTKGFTLNLHIIKISWNWVLVEIEYILEISPTLDSKLGVN